MKAIGDIKPKREFTAVANGAITSGDPCIIESAGTVAAVAEAQAVFSTPTFNSEQDFQSVGGNYLASASIGSNKVILAWRVANTSPYPMKAVVATVDSNNNTISYGTVSTFDTPSLYGGTLDIAYDPDNSKFAIFYSVDNNKLKVIIGTVSGTTLSFGSAVTYASYDTSQTCSYAGNGKFIVYGRDPNNSNYLYGYGVTVSGTTPTVGTKTTIDTNNTLRTPFCSIWNDTAERSVTIIRSSNFVSYARVCKITTGTTISVGNNSATFIGSDSSSYPNGGVEVPGTKNILISKIRSGGGYGAMIYVGTIDETTETISFSTNYTYMAYDDGRTNLYHCDVGYDPTTGAVLAVAHDYDETGYQGFAALGTLSGTTVTFGGSEAAYTDGVNSAENSTVVYDPSSGRFLIFWGYTNDSMTGLVANHETLATNVTAENFIGFADNDYADTADATVQLTGSIIRDQSGLTAGQKYYVQTDGSLGTTADDPSVVAGTAISATELIVKG